MLTWQQPRLSGTQLYGQTLREVSTSSPMGPAVLLSSNQGQMSQGPDSVIITSVLNPLSPASS